MFNLPLTTKLHIKVILEQFDQKLSAVGDKLGSARAKSKCGCIIGLSLGPVFQLKRWPFAIMHKKYLAGEQSVLIWKNSAQMMEP